VLNAANEVAVARFLEGGLRFPEIALTVADALAAANFVKPESIDDVLQIDREIRSGAHSAMKATCH